MDASDSRRTATEDTKDLFRGAIEASSLVTYAGAPANIPR